MYRGKVDYSTSVATESGLSLCLSRPWPCSSFVYDKKHFQLGVKWAFPKNSGMSTFFCFVFVLFCCFVLFFVFVFVFVCLFVFAFSQFLFTFTCFFHVKLNNLHGVKLLSGTFAFYWNF